LDPSLARIISSPPHPFTVGLSNINYLFDLAAALSICPGEKAHHEADQPNMAPAPFPGFFLFLLYF
jgi:hypothetical protein